MNDSLLTDTPCEECGKAESFADERICRACRYRRGCLAVSVALVEDEDDGYVTIVDVTCLYSNN